MKLPVRDRVRCAAVILISSSLASIAFAEVPAPRLIRSDFYDPEATASIGAGSFLQEVRLVFGQLPDESDGSCFCMDGSGASVDGIAKMLFYPGFDVTLEKYPGSSDYVTTRIGIRAQNLWVTPGLAVGVSVNSLKALLGKPDLVGVDGSSGERIQHYSFVPEGDLRVHVAHGVVSLIEIYSRGGTKCG
jgi:hypothetical protein